MFSGFIRYPVFLFNLLLLLYDERKKKGKRKPVKGAKRQTPAALLAFVQTGCEERRRLAATTPQPGGYTYGYHVLRDLPFDPD